MLARELKADLYHFHDPELILAGLALRTGGSRVIYDIHEDVPRALLSRKSRTGVRFFKRILSVMVEVLENHAARWFTACIAVTPHIANRFRGIQSNTFIVNNYPILNELNPKGRTQWSERQNAVAYVGVIAMTRGLKEMVRAMHLLPDTLHARLKLVGNFSPASSRWEVEGMAGWDTVDEMGFLARQDVRDVLDKVRIGLVLFHPLSNHTEAQPNKLFEYMSAGIPVIASDFPRWRQLIEEEGCGIVVDPLDPHAIARAIEYLLTHDEEAEEMGRKGQRAIEQRYDWLTESKKLTSIYRSVLTDT